MENISYNYAYFPIYIDEEKFPIKRDELYSKLKENNIYARRYFYPLITSSQHIEGWNSSSGKFPVAEKIADEVLCLPIYVDLKIAEIEQVIR